MPILDTTRLSVEESLVLTGGAMPDIDGDPEALDDLEKLGFQFFRSCELSSFIGIDRMPEGWSVKQLKEGLTAVYDQKERQRLLIDPLGEYDRQGKPVKPPSTTIIPRLEGFVARDLSYLFSNNQLVVVDHATGKMASSDPILVPIPLREVFTFLACNDPKILETLNDLRKQHGEINKETDKFPDILSLAMIEAFSGVITQPDVPDPFDIVVPERVYDAFASAANSGLGPVRRQIGVLNQKIKELEARLPPDWEKSLEF